MDRLPFLGGSGTRGPLGTARGPFGGGSTSGFFGFRHH